MGSGSARGLKLAELAELVAPLEWRARNQLQGILRHDWEVRGAHSKRLYARAKSLIPKWRERRMRSAKIDRKSLLPKEVVRDGSFGAVLLKSGSLTERKRHIAQDARDRALDEILSPRRRKYRHFRTKLDQRIEAKLRAKMTESGVAVRATNGAQVRRLLDRVELLDADIDVDRETLTIHGHTWTAVQIEMHGIQNSDDGGPRGAGVSEKEIAKWMLSKQRELKNLGERAGRDRLISFAMTEFGLKQDTVRAAWDGRQGARKRS